MSPAASGSIVDPVPVQQAMGDRFVQVMTRHLIRSIQIRDRSSDATDSIESSNTQSKFLDRSDEMFEVRPFQRNQFFEGLSAKTCVQTIAPGRGEHPGIRHPPPGLQSRADGRWSLQQ